jgi:ATP-binding cassette subfamily F protein 3
MVSVNILIQALQQYEGTFVVVSHDRFFVSQIANKIWYIEDHEIKEYPGTFDEYEYWREQRDADRKAGILPEPLPKKVVVKQENPNSDARKEAQNNLKKAERRLEEVEKAISDLETKKAGIEAEIAKPAIYENAQKLKEHNTELSKVSKELEAQMQLWETVSTEIESLQQA